MNVTIYYGDTIGFSEHFSRYIDTDYKNEYTRYQSGELPQMVIAHYFPLYANISLYLLIDNPKPESIQCRIENFADSERVEAVIVTDDIITAQKLAKYMTEGPLTRLYRLEFRPHLYDLWSPAAATEENAAFWDKVKTHDKGWKLSLLAKDGAKKLELNTEEKTA